MQPSMNDRGLVLAVSAAIAALVAGVLAVELDTAVLGVVAGSAGVVAGAAATATVGRARHAERELADVDTDRRRLRRELDALTALFEDEARTREATRATTPPELPAFDDATGLYDQSYFAVLAQQQVAAARRSLRPVSVVIFEIDQMRGADTASRDQALELVGDLVRRTLREADAACRLGEMMIGAILEDTPEVGGVWAAERVRGALLGSALGDSVTVSAGVSCYPTHALGAAELVSAAGRALDEARLHGADRVELAPEA